MRKKSYVVNFCRNLFVVSGLVGATTMVFAHTNNKDGEKVNTSEQLPWLSEVVSSSNEIISERDRTSKHYLLPNGKRKMVSASSSIHYKEAGDWKEIDLTIVSNNSVLHPYKNEKNAFKTYYPSNPVLGKVRTVLNSGVMEESISALHFSDANNSVLHTFTMANPSVSNVQANKIEYANVYSFASARYFQGNDGRKFDLVLNNNSYLNQIPAGATHIVLEEKVTIPAHWTVEKTELGIYLKNGDKNEALFPNPMAHEDENSGKIYENEEDFMVNGEISFVRNGNELTIYTRFPLSWLSANNRSYPIYLDPVVQYEPDNVANWTGRQSTSTGKTSGYLRITGGTTASWAKFNISTMPSSAQVLDASYNGYHYSGTGNSVLKEVQLRTLQSDPVLAVAATLWSESNTGTVISDTFGFALSSNYQWHQGEFNATGRADVQTAQTQGWYAVGMTWVAGGTGFAYHYGWNGTTNRCYLEVDYITAMDDAGVHAIDSPNVPSCTSNDVWVRLENFGINALQTALVNWSVNGLLQPTYSFSGNVAPTGGVSQPVMIGSYNFDSGDVLRIWTSDPNSQTDIFTDNDTLEFHVPIHEVADLPSSLIVCKAGVGTLDPQVTGASTFIWNTGSTDSSIMVDSAGTYSVTVTDPITTCVSIASSEVSISVPVELPDSVRFCEGGVATLEVNMPGNYFWSTGSTSSAVQITESGSYTVTLTDLLGCVSEATSEVVEVLLPIAEFDTFTLGYGARFTNLSQNATHYLWDFGDGSTSDEESPTRVYDWPGGTFTVTLYAGNECDTSEFTLTVTVGLDVSVNELKVLDKMAVFPNPNHGKFSLEMQMNSSAPVSYTIYDISGKALLQRELGVTSGLVQQTIDLNVAPGMYFMQVNAGDENQTFKISIH